jgi:hypothetical protein
MCCCQLGIPREAMLRAMMCMLGPMLCILGLMQHTHAAQPKLLSLLRGWVDARRLPAETALGDGR